MENVPLLLNVSRCITVLICKLAMTFFSFVYSLGYLLCMYGINGNNLIWPEMFWTDKYQSCGQECQHVYNIVTESIFWYS